MEKKIILSGIQPSGIPTLGNYVGALRNWKLLQSDDKLHAVLIRQLRPFSSRVMCINMLR